MAIGVLERISTTIADPPNPALIEGARTPESDDPVSFLRDALLRQQSRSGVRHAHSHPAWTMDVEASALREKPRRLAVGDRSWGEAEAAALRPHRGRFVALVGLNVVTTGDTIAEVVSWLREHGRTAETVFRVPIDPRSGLGSLSG